jgi:general secretion pathway protein D
MRLKSTLAVLAIALPLVAPSQFDNGSKAGSGGSTSGANAWDSMMGSSRNKTMTLSFRNANVDMVLEAFSKASGITIIKDPAITTTLTLTTPKPVKLSEAFNILNLALKQRNFELRKEGNVLVAGPKRQDQPSFDPSMFQGMQQQKPELRVYPITFANASDVARIVNEVFLPSGASGGNNIAQMMGRFGGGAGRFGGGRFGGGNFGGANFGNLLSAATTDPNDTVRASSDDYSNSVIVLASSQKHIEVNDFIKKIDKQTASPQVTRVYPLKFAKSDDLQTVVSTTLNSLQPTGRGGTTTNQQNNRGGFNPFGGLFGQNRNNGQVASEARSNSLIVTTTEDNHLVVKRVIEELDKDLPIENTTFVIPLVNAKAEDVAQLLQNTFGTRQGSNNRGTTTNRTGSTTTGSNRTTNRNTGNRTTNGLGGRTNGPDLVAQNVGPDGLNLDLADPNASAGDLRTQFFFGVGGQNQNRTSNTTQLARGADGQLVNTRDLTNQVTVIPDNNTNSIIVVADPGNYKLLQNIIDQLDRIPEQVMIETMIVEASLTKNDKLGVEWNLVQAKAFGNEGTTGNIGQTFGLQTTTPAPTGFKYTLTGGNLTAFVNALQTDSRFNILSTPRIFTSNQQQATINISQSVPYVLSTRTDANGNISFNYGFQDVGIVLNVTPRITANGYVTLDVDQTANDLQGYTSFNAPIVNQREAQTTVSVKDGETVILGGMIRSQVTSTVNKLPILGDLPFLGNLFRSTSKENQKTELMIMLTPRIVRTAEDAKRIREKTENEFNNESGQKPKSSNGGTSQPQPKGTGKGGGL